MDNLSIEPKRDESRLSSVEMATDSLIRRKTASEALQHPATLLPAGACVISLLYGVVLSPMLGGTAVSVSVAVVAGATAIGSYFYQYQKRYPLVARDTRERLALERIRLEEASLNGLCERLRDGFVTVSSTEGLRTLTELIGAYEQLQPAIERRRDTDPLSVSLVPALAGETYRTGLSILSNALDLMRLAYPNDSPEGQAGPATDRKERLSHEIVELERTIESIQDRPDLAERLALALEMLASKKERLAMFDQLGLHIDRLLHQARRCEASLYSTQIDLASIRAGGSKASVDMVLEALRSTIRQAKEVQDEFERLGR